MRINYFVLLVIVLVSFSCKDKTNKSTVPAKTEVSKTANSFEMVKLPMTIVDDNEKLVYFCMHWWDNFNFKDTTYIHLPDITEQAFVNYLSFLGKADKATVNNSISHCLNLASVDSTMLNYFYNQFEHYLYEPNSPMRNEELFIPVLESYIKLESVDDVFKIRPKALLQIALMNRPGNKANNFTYTLADGKSSDLYSINTKYIILYINNPDCSACKEFKQLITVSEIVNKMIDNKSLTLLAVYPDADLELWKKYVDQTPKKWINSYDKGQIITNKRLYDLKAVPTMYLLDENKKVLLKDALFQNIEQYLIFVTKSKR